MTQALVDAENMLSVGRCSSYCQRSCTHLIEHLIWQHHHRKLLSHDPVLSWAVRVSSLVSTKTSCVGYGESKRFLLVSWSWNYYLWSVKWILSLIYLLFATLLVMLNFSNWDNKVVLIVFRVFVLFAVDPGFYSILRKDFVDTEKWDFRAE